MKDPLHEFAADLAYVCAHLPLFPERPLYWTIIANPKAGGFTIGSRWREHQRALKEYCTKIASWPVRPVPGGPSRTAREADRGNGSLGALGLVPTTEGGHACRIVNTLLDEATAAIDAAQARQEAPPFFLILTAGGDGTSLEALTSLFYGPPQVVQHMAIVRLPMGTGNDGADAPTMAATLAHLVNARERVFQRAVTMRLSSSKGPFVAFNILSVGLDAFVTHMTNKMKGHLPGDSYKFWVDVATLFYECWYPVRPMRIEVLAGKEAPGPEDASVAKGLSPGSDVPTVLEGPFLLAALGVSGRRTYGGGIPILPDERNFLAIEQMGLLKKLKLKGLFTTGQHGNRPEAHFFTTEGVRIYYNTPILAQMDGESVLLEPGDFPITLELSPPRIPVLTA
ncbi:MAG TPA: diacylglycerol kinase family protein [Termitinemataceae bacterium]|nr:diacylglycerol kinase family protein [Termitinemataceae bacterium]HPQ00943.1 diacylglycerol kinase family protein [Termitinemataceae bacterium]